MNHISQLYGSSTTILLSLLLITPSIITAFLDALIPDAIATLNNPNYGAVVDTKNKVVVQDTKGNNVQTNTPYLFVPSINTKGLDENSRGIDLFSLNQTCPFHVSLGQTPLPLKFKTNSPDHQTDIHTGDTVYIEFDNPGNDGCSEPKGWQLVFPQMQVLNSRGYIKTGASFGKQNDVMFRLKSVEGNKFVYIIQSCSMYDVQGLSCTDVKLVNIQPDIMVLVIDDGVPLHVKFNPR